MIPFALMASLRNGDAKLFDILCPNPDGKGIASGLLVDPR